MAIIKRMGWALLLVVALPFTILAGVIIALSLPIWALWGAFEDAPLYEETEAPYEVEGKNEAME